MAVAGVRMSRSRNAAGMLVVRLGVRLLDEYLEFLSGRCRPNTMLAVAHDLKVFFTVVGTHDCPAGRRGRPPAGRGFGPGRGVGPDAAAPAVERVRALRVPARPR
jgi:hypothetical protein